MAVFIFNNTKVNKKSDIPNENCDGFSLVELLVVLAIIGLVAGLVAPRVLGYIDTSKVATAGVQIKNIKGALDLYYMDVGSFPSPEEGLSALSKKPASATIWNGPYLKNIDDLNDPWGHAYLYIAPNDTAELAVRSLGRDGKEGGAGLDADLPR